MILRELVVALGVKVDEQGLRKADTFLDNVTKSAYALGAAFAGGALVRGVATLVDQTTQAGDHAAKMAAQFGLAVEDLQKLNYAAELSGATVENMRVALSRLSQQAANAAGGNKEAAATFARLGIKVRDANGRVKDTGDLFREAADQIAATENPTLRAGIAIKLFGESGARLVPLLSKGSKGLEGFGAELEGLGGVMDKDFTDASEGYRDDLTRMQRATQGLQMTVTRALLPALSWLVRKGTELAAFFSAALKNTRAVEAAFVVLGAAAIAVGIKMMIPFLPFIGMALLVAAALGVIVLVIDELWVHMNGGKTVIGDIIAGFGKFWQSILLFESADKHLNTFLIKPLQTILWLWGEIFKGVIAVTKAIAAVPAVKAVGALLIGDAQPTADLAKGAWSGFKDLLGVGQGTGLGGLLGTGTEAGGQRFGGAVSSNSSSNVSNTVTNQFTISGAGDPQAVAAAVREELGREYGSAYDATVPGVM